ncbi:MAG: amidohydrolase family protein [Alphaproteobacteria bacterium]|nr:amidohydrolase family protein [Alphaproteobacteria bacterium]
MRTLLAFSLLLLAWRPTLAAEPVPLIDAHIHYSHDAWDLLPPVDAVAALRAAGLKRAFVSSSSDEGTQKLYALAPDLIVPVLRPYRARGETSSWLRDDTVPTMLEALMQRNRYAGIGEFHVFSANADLPVMRAVVRLAAKHHVFLHLHGDAEAVERVFAQDPDARVLWAHSGFDQPEAIGALLAKYDHLWADLAFRSEHGADGTVPSVWRGLFDRFPDRFMIGTDTYTPERWYYVGPHATWTRAWLADLPPELARRIAYENAETLAAWGLGE